MVQKLYRSESEKIVGGVCGGVAEYYHVDPNIIRLGFLIILLLTGVLPGVVLYIIAYYMLPTKHENHTDMTLLDKKPEETTHTNQEQPTDTSSDKTELPQ